MNTNQWIDRFIVAIAHGLTVLIGLGAFNAEATKWALGGAAVLYHLAGMAAKRYVPTGTQKLEVLRLLPLLVLFAAACDGCKGGLLPFQVGAP